VSVPPPPDLTEEDGRTLLDLARAALEAHVRGTPVPGTRVPGGGARLGVPAGVFVTLRLDGELRGCIGSLDRLRPLREAVEAAAVAAAFGDPRFEPLAHDVLERVAMEVTVLGAPGPLDPAGVRIGRHGLIVSRGARRGLLLPQVADERGWNVETFLAETCRKAGLESGAWRLAGTRVEAFEARVFREDGRDGRRSPSRPGPSSPR
jgi:AmmeMemoRadiSam system protein A